MTGQGETRFAPAKVNLFLHVGDKRPDGYHNLKSLVVFAETGDTVTISGAQTLTLTAKGPYAKGLDTNASNLVMRAARALMAWSDKHLHKISQVHLELDKQLPLASGIGGGSTDAAATLQLLAKFWSLPIHADDMAAIGRSIGADVPVCLRASPTLMSGSGEILESVPATPDFAFVLVNPGIAVPTASVFNALQVRSGAFAPMWPQKFATLRDFVAWLDRTNNDLSAPAKSIAPEIMCVEQALVATPGCLLARMSGSGATCFGIFPTIEAATSAARQIRENHKAWWVQAAKTFSTLTHQA